MKAGFSCDGEQDRPSALGGSVWDTLPGRLHRALLRHSDLNVFKKSLRLTQSTALLFSQTIDYVIIIFSEFIQKLNHDSLSLTGNTGLFYLSLGNIDSTSAHGKVA